MADFIISQGDTKPIFAYSCVNPDGTIPNLTGATVRFAMRSAAAAAPQVNALATIVNAVAGTVSYTPLAADTATPGLYAARFRVTFADGSIQSYPTDGYLEVVVEEDLTTSTIARVVSLGEIREHLRIQTADRTIDARLLRLTDALAPVIADITGPLTQSTVTEWHDGGATQLVVRQPPIGAVASVFEYRGNVKYTLAQVASPDLATSMSYMWEANGIITRLNGAAAAAAVYLSSQGLFATFPTGPNSVQVVYTAGSAVPGASVKEGMLELLRFNFQSTERGGRAAAGEAGPATMMSGFLVPNKVKELLQPTARPPAIA